MSSSVCAPLKTLSKLLQEIVNSFGPSMEHWILLFKANQMGKNQGEKLWLTHLGMQIIK